MTTIMDNAMRDSVRLLLGEDDTSLPDTTINNALFGGAAETYVLTRVEPPAYTARDTTEQGMIRQAIVLTTAALLLDSGAYRDKWSMVSEKFSDQYSMSRAAGAMDVPGWRASLWTQVRDLLDGLTDRPDSVAFRLAAGRRGA